MGTSTTCPTAPAESADDRVARDAARKRQALISRHRETAFELANDAIVLAKLDGTIIDWNERAPAMYGYTSGEFGRLNLGDLRSEHSRDRFGRDMSALRFQGSRTYETEHQRKDGSVFPLEASVRVIELDGHLYFNGVLRDITERRQAETRVRTLSRLYATISEANKAVIVAGDRTSLFTGICRACASHGLAMAWVGRIDADGRVVPVAADGIGTPYLDGIDITTSPGAPTSLGPTGRAATTGGHVICNDFDNDYRMVPWRDRARAFGWQASAAFPLREDGRIVAVLTLYSDVPRFFDTSEVTLLDELASTISFALDRIGGVERREAAESALAAKNVELERFNYVAAHHLQEPVRTQVSFCQLLERTLGARLMPDDRELLNYVVGGAKRMRDLVTGMLCLAKARHPGNGFAPVALGALAAVVVSDLADAIRAAGASVTISALPTIMGDAAGLYQVLHHLLGNAIKFRASGRPLTIAVDAVSAAGQWLISVADNGIGIEDQYVDTIADAFVRLHPPETYPGTGIGLTVCRQRG